MRIRPLLNSSAGRLVGATVLAVGILSGSGCGSDNKPITAQNSKYQVAEDSDSSGSAQSPAKDSAAPVASTGEGAVPIAPPSTDQANRSSSLSGANSTEPSTESDSSSNSQTGAPRKPSATPPADTAKSPAEEQAQKLFEQMASLQNRDPRGTTQEETMNNLMNTQSEIIKIAEKLMGMQIDDKSLLKAANAKIQALTFLAQFNRDSQPQLKAFLAELKASPKPALTQLARHMEFAQQMQAFANGQKSDVAKLQADFKKVFEEQPKDAALFQLSQQVTEIFLQTGNSKEAVDVMKLVADTYESNPDAQLVSAAKMVREQIAIVEVDLDAKISAVLEDKPNADQEFLAMLDKLFASPALGDLTRQFLSQMAMVLESRNKMDLTEKMFTSMVAAYEKKGNEEITKAVKDMAEKFGKRKAIIGNPFAVEGVTLEGQPFDWNKYKGKVVLVDFWATWCEPCLREIPNIKQNYDQYHDQGFEVVGVNIDEEPEALQRFFSRQRLPWPTVVSSDPKQVGFEHPLLVKSGAEGIPFLVLVGRDGKAIALNPRGPELGKQLAALFDTGAPAAKKSSPAAPKKTEK